LQTSGKTPWIGYWHVARRLNTQHNTKAKTDQLYIYAQSEVRNHDTFTRDRRQDMPQTEWLWKYVNNLNNYRNNNMH